MTRLFNHLRVHQLFGANTDVGKTIITTALCRASALRQKPVFYLKPVSTGPLSDADDGHVKQYSGRFGDHVQAHCLFRYSEPVSPHLAAQLSTLPGEQENTVLSDAVLVNSIATHIDTCASSAESAVLYLETAGGPHSPVPSGNAQADAYRPLFLPTILVGDPKLGGISTTISAYESLLLRGYHIDGVAIFRDSYYRNFEYLAQYFTDRDVPFSSVPPPPAKVGNRDEDHNLTEHYYSQIVPEERGSEILTLDAHLSRAHTRRLENLETMPSRTMNTVWWPFVQHGSVRGPEDVTVIDSAWGDFFSVYNSTSAGSLGTSSSSLLSQKFDGSASWWTQALGHGNPSLTLAAAKAAGRYGHVIFPQASHLPALRLAERLVHAGPGSGWASRAYFSDDGSTGMEIALKMAFRAFAKREGWKKHTGSNLGVLGLKGSYHGDTIGAMDACEEGIFTCEWHHAKGYWFDPPTVGIHAGHVAVTLPPSMSSFDKQSTIQFSSLSALYDVEARLRSPLAEWYRDFISKTLSWIQSPGRPKLAALVLEPLVMGAGGMVFVDPLFQRVLVDAVRSDIRPEVSDPLTSTETRWHGIPVIFDEVFVGLYRLGLQTCSTLLGVHPDIAVYAKILTGGLVPMAVTLASDSIFQAFMGETKAEALLHGHSYTAHPVGCEVANEALSLLDRVVQSDEWARARNKWSEEPTGQPSASVWSLWDPAFVNALSLNPNIEEVMSLGTVLAFKLRDQAGGYGSSSAQTSLAFLKGASILDGSSAPFGVHFRTLGNVAYFMCSLSTSSATLRGLENSIISGLTTENNH